MNYNHDDYFAYEDSVQEAYLDQFEHWSWRDLAFCTPVSQALDIVDGILGMITHGCSAEDMPF